MSSTVRFDLPYPRFEHPALPQAREHGRVWLAQQRLLSDADLERFLRWGYDVGTAQYLPPNVTPEGLCLAVDAVNWFTIFNDFIDDGHHHRDLQKAVVDELLAITRRPPDEPPLHDRPLVTAFADVWRRVNVGMSAAWRERAAHYWRRFVEARDAVSFRTRIPSPEECLEIRRHHIGFNLIAVLTESASNAELPPVITGHPDFRIMLDALGEVLAILNDTHSLDRDIAQGTDRVNVVLAMEIERQCSRDTAIDILKTMTSSRMRIYEEKKLSLLGVLSESALPETARAQVRHYLEHWGTSMRANEEFGLATSRYDKAESDWAPVKANS